ncbi:unnamed protein product, partial [Pylaiella littoralis]
EDVEKSPTTKQPRRFAICAEEKTEAASSAMGAYLSQPVLEKETEDGADETGLKWGAAGMQGWRTGMEDSHLACLDLNGGGRGGGGDIPAAAAAADAADAADAAAADAADAAAAAPDRDPSKKIAAFAVFDGHGGAEVAKYCAAHICDVVRDTEAFKEGDLGLGLKQTFLKMDDMLRTPAGQAELRVLKKASTGDDSDSDEGEEEAVDLDKLSKIAPETQMQIMEQMKRAMLDQFRSAGKVSGGAGLGAAEGDDEDSEGSKHDDDSKYSSEEEEDDEEEEEKEDVAEESGKDDPKSKEENGGGGTATATAAASAAAAATTVASKLESKEGARDDQQNAKKEKQEEEEEEGGMVVAPAVLPPPLRPSVVTEAGGVSKGDAVEPDSTAEEWAAGAPGEESKGRRRCGFDCGATAVMGLLVGGKTLVVANAGDSRCVVSRKGEAVDMSTDHKPEDDVELARIEKAGGAVVDGRVQGNLNLSRAIGDLMYKADEALSPEEQMITADPELKTLELTPEDEFIVLACDGVWNSLTSQETIDFVRTRLIDSGDEPPLSKACSDLCDACCADTVDGDGTGLDNVTAVIVQLNTEGARALTGGAGKGTSGEGDMDTSDDGKRKQGVQGETEGEGGGEEGDCRSRKKKHMKAEEEAEEAAAAAQEAGPDL